VPVRRAAAGGAVRRRPARSERRPRRGRAYPEAFTLRCFAFQPSDAQVEEDKADKKHLLVFPPAQDGAPPRPARLLVRAPPAAPAARPPAQAACRAWRATRRWSCWTLRPACWRSWSAGC